VGRLLHYCRNELVAGVPISTVMPILACRRRRYVVESSDEEPEPARDSMAAEGKGLAAPSAVDAPAEASAAGPGMHQGRRSRC
jgi:hypothetical protein